MDKKKATQKLDEVVGRAIRDEAFRKQLAADPKGTLEGEGLSEEDLEGVAGGVSLGTAAVAKPSASLYQNIATVFQNPLGNLTKVAWCTDKTCNERG
jgi:hypothetical protein